MRRREFITLLGGAVAAWPIAARAQQRERMQRIGVLMHLAADDPEGQSRLAAFLQGLQEAGFAEGRNVAIKYRWAEAQFVHGNFTPPATAHKWRSPNRRQCRHRRQNRGQKRTPPPTSCQSDQLY
jgi:hypothetical protein